MWKGLARWDKESVPVERVPTEDDCTDMAIGHLRFARACQMRSERFHLNHPFWWHLLASLCVNDWHSFVSDLRRVGVDTVHMWRMVQRLMSARDASRVMPNLCFAGRPTGMRWTDLVPTGNKCWGTVLRRLANLVSQRRRPVLLAVPWDPAKNSDLQDAVCSCLMHLASRFGDPAFGERLWVHVKAGELVTAEKTRSEQGFLHKTLIPSSVKVRHMLGEAERNAVLCLSGIDAWLNRSETDLNRRAKIGLRKITTLKIPTVGFVKRGERVNRVFPGHGFDVWELEPMRTQELKSFLMQLERRRCDIPDPVVHEDALDEVIADAQRRVTENDWLDRCMLALKIAHELAGSEGISRQWVKEAIVQTDRLAES